MKAFFDDVEGMPCALVKLVPIGRIKDPCPHCGKRRLKGQLGTMCILHNGWEFYVDIPVFQCSACQKTHMFDDHQAAIMQAVSEAAHQAREIDTAERVSPLN